MRPPGTLGLAQCDGIHWVGHVSSVHFDPSTLGSRLHGETIFGAEVEESSYEHLQPCGINPLSIVGGFHRLNTG